MSSVHELIDIPPTKQFSTDEEIAALQAKQKYVANKMGNAWLLHPDNEVQKKSA